jgi:hypothetical protein
MSEHRDAREALELAAVEPGGLDRLEAGDTAEAAAVVAHLAGCPACLEEMARLRRADALLRPILASAPDPALRERTLAFVRAAGVPRGAAGEPASRVPRGAAGEPAPRAPAARRRVRFGWAAALAAALVVGLLGGALVVRVAAPDGNADPAVALDQVTRETTALIASGDSREVVLTGDPGKSGTLILSPTAGRMVVSATGLATPPSGSEYRCWVEVNGTRVALGAMWWAGNVAWWAGDVAIPAVIPPGVVYGVSLVEAGAPGPGTVVLTGSL